MKGAISAAIATACVTASAAVAADMPIKAAPPVSVVVNDWSGFYLGAHGGYGWGHEDFRQDTGGTTIAGTALNLPNVTLTGLNSKGWVGGFQAGYNWQHTQWVGGLEIDLSGAGIKGTTANSASASGVDPFTGATVTSTVSASQSNKFEMLGSARARVGYLVTPNILLYGTGGLGWTRQIGANTVTQTSGVAAGLTLSTTSTLSGTSSLFGWVAGVGGEAKIFDSNWLFRVEYLHYDFGDLNSSTITTGSVTGAAFTPITNGSTKLTVDVVRAGISYKFGGGAVVARY